MRRLIACFLLLFAAFGLRAEVVDIDNGTLAKLAAGGMPVVDVRTAPEWQETGVLAGSHLMTFFNDNGQSDPTAWLSKFKALVPPNTPVAIICRSGRRSAAVGRFLNQQAGYAKVYNVSGGIRSWAAERRPLVPVAPRQACGGAKNCR